MHNGLGIHVHLSKDVKIEPQEEARSKLGVRSSSPPGVLPLKSPRQLVVLRKPPPRDRTGACPGSLAGRTGAQPAHIVGRFFLKGLTSIAGSSGSLHKAYPWGQVSTPT